MENYLTTRRLILIIASGILLLLALALTDPGFAAPAPFASPVQDCQQPRFFVVEVVTGRDWDAKLGRFVTWQVYMRGADGHSHSAMTWWPHYVPGDLIRLCDGEQFPWGEWQRTFLPLLRK